MKYDFDCVVVGCGIAGMTSAIYLKRSNLNVLILDSSAPGGLLNNISSIENYPGFSSITGPDLAYQIYEQVKENSIEIRYGNVLNIDDHIITTDIEKISAKKVLIAAGRKARKLDSASNLKNVSYCALCDGNLYKNKTIALIGGGNSALEEALYLADLCKEVILIHRSNLKGEEAIQDKVKNTSNISIYENCVIKTLKENNHILTHVETDKNTFEVDGMFISIGYEPNTNWLNQIETDKGYIIVDNKMQTNIDYIYACGDIIKKDIYQLTTAVGEATIAAVNIKKTIKSI